LKKYKIIIEQKINKDGEKVWEFEGPGGPFTIPWSLLPISQAQLEGLLTRCGFVVEWREMNDPA